MSCVVFLILLQASSAHVCALRLCCYELFHSVCGGFFFLGGSAMKGTEQ